MMGKNTKKKKYSRNRRSDELDSRFNIRLFISLSILLAVLLMHKYEFRVGDIDVDKIYEIVYRHDDFGALKDTVFNFNEPISSEGDSGEVAE